MSKPAFLTVALCVLPTFVVALDRADCRAVEAAAFSSLEYVLGLEVTPSDTTQTTSIPDGCAATDLDIRIPEYELFFTAQSLTYTGRALTQWAQGDVIMPSQLSLRLDGITLQAAPDYLEWMHQLARPDVPASIDLDWTWIEQQRHLVDAVAIFDFGDANGLTLTLAGRAPQWEPYGLSVEGLEVTHFTHTTRFNGVFERAIAPALEAQGYSLSPFTILMFAAGLQNIMGAMPEGMMPAEPAADLIAFTRSLPEPNGVLRLEANSDIPFDPLLLAYDLMDNLTINTPPDALRLSADWTPAD